MDITDLFAELKAQGSGHRAIKLICDQCLTFTLYIPFKKVKHSSNLRSFKFNDPRTRY